MTALLRVERNGSRGRPNRAPESSVGSQPWKISQEIQPNWFEVGGNAQVQINMQTAFASWTMNDPVERVIYFGIPLGQGHLPDHHLHHELPRA
jgi:hypothetical protein